MTTRVAVVGDVMVDVVARVQAPFAHASDTPTRIVTAPGGAAANQAVWLARAGAEVLLVAVVGDDPGGDASLRALRRAGVDVSCVRRVSGATGTVVALIEPDGQRSMLTDRGANLTLDREAVAPLAGRLSRGSHVHVSGYCLLDERTRAAGLAARDHARSTGATWSVDASSASPLLEAGPARFLEWIGGADYLFANLDEGRALTGRTDPSDVLADLGHVAEEVVLTLGAVGSLVSDRGVVHARRPEPGAAPAADTTGAGDALLGTYLARRLAGASAPAAMAAAAAAAATAVRSEGARRWPELLA